MTASNYAPCADTVQLPIAPPPPAPRPPRLVWRPPAPVPYGTTLDEGQFDAVVVPPVPGVFTYYVPDYAHEDDDEPRYVFVRLRARDVPGAGAIRV